MGGKETGRYSHNNQIGGRGGHTARLAAALPPVIGGGRYRGQLGHTLIPEHGGGEGVLIAIHLGRLPACRTALLCVIFSLFVVRPRGRRISEQPLHCVLPRHVGGRCQLCTAGVSLGQVERRGGVAQRRPLHCVAPSGHFRVPAAEHVGSTREGTCLRITGGGIHSRYASERRPAYTDSVRTQVVATKSRACIKRFMFNFVRSSRRLLSDAFRHNNLRYR